MVLRDLSQHLAQKRYLVSPTCQVLRNDPKDRLVHAPAHPLQRSAKPDTVIDSETSSKLTRTYVGGKKHDGMRGRGASGQTPVVGRALPSRRNPLSCT